MVSQIHDFLLRVKRYFLCLGAALIGRDPYEREREELKARIDQTIADLKHLRLLCNSAFERWNDASGMVVSLKKEVASYQKLIETLRGTIRDKEKELAEQRTRFLEQLELAHK